MPVLTGLLVGLMFLGAAYLMHQRPRPGELCCRGTVVEVWHGYAYGEPTWRSRVEFRDVSGKLWRFEPELSGPTKPDVGGQIALSYLPADPLGTVRQTDGPIRWYPWLAAGMGVAAILSGPFLSSD